MNLADPELEFIDPAPNVHSLFIHFDAVFFWTKLAGKAVVRWSKRMYSCAGICSYEGRGGICDIALSEPLLKLRPRKDLVETLLHEMIHAYLFVVGKDQSRDGHGPNFLSHMHRINQAAGVKISVYHDFHDEVRLYQNHVWRCNGPCQKMRPYFGIVRRTMNRAPGPSDNWWNTHKRVCGGTFIKLKEPEKVVKQSKKKVSKPNADITKYINTNTGINNKNSNTPIIKGLNDILKTTNKVTNKVGSPKPVVKPTVFTGSGQVSGRPRSNSVSVLEIVRNVWANKTIPSIVSDTTKKTPKVTNQITKISGVNAKKPSNISSPVNTNKRISDVSSDSPQKKMKKIDDYFKTTASSILKDVYGKDFTVTQSSDTNKLKAVAINTDKDTLVECPICNAKVSKVQINTHIDECLNKDVIEKLSNETIKKPKPSHMNNNEIDRRKLIDLHIPAFKPKIEVKPERQTINVIKPEIKDKIDLVTNTQVKIEPSTSIDLTAVKLKTEPNIPSSIDLTNLPGTSKSHIETKETHTCPCCGKTIDKPVQEHLDECLTFFDNNTTIPEENILDRTIVIDDSDDEFDETQTFNATGTKSPCPCCMKMIEDRDMNEHLDVCLGL